MIEHSLKIIKSEERDTTSVRELISTLKKKKKKRRRAKILHYPRSHHRHQSRPVGLHDETRYFHLGLNESHRPGKDIYFFFFLSL